MKPSTPRLDIQPVSPEATHPHRQRWLRAHQTLEQMELPGDRDADALHLIARIASRVAGVASVMRERPTAETAPLGPATLRSPPGDWRLRAMACAPEHRRQGIGAALLTRCAAHAQAHGGAALWCQARIEATPFYAQMGLEPLGEPFEVAGIGPHVFMWRSLRGGNG